MDYVRHEGEPVFAAMSFDDVLGGKEPEIVARKSGWSSSHTVHLAGTYDSSGVWRWVEVMSP